MKQIIITFLFSVLLINLRAQSVIPQGSILYDVPDGDSVVVYQCHVENATPQLTTQSGQTVTGTQQRCTITEKYVFQKSNEGFKVKYFTTALSVFPNKKFSGLKIRERPYWDFKQQKIIPVTDQGLQVLLALERKGREAIEYDFGITKYTTNQIIIKRKKNFKQLVIEGDYVISKLLPLN